MSSEPMSGERMIAYLMGELPPGELAEIDRRLLEDEDFAEGVQEARNDLLDSLAQGGLAPEQRDRVRRALGLPPGERSAEMEFSRALRMSLEREKARQAPRAVGPAASVDSRSTGAREPPHTSEPAAGARDPSPRTGDPSAGARDRASRTSEPAAGARDRSRRAGPARPRARSAPTWAVPLAACLALAAGLWTAREVVIDRQSGARPGELAGAGGAGAASPAAENAVGPAYALVLSPEVLRGQSAQQTVTVPRAVSSLAVQIVVPDPAVRYEVSVQSPSGRSTYTDLAPRSAGGVSYVQLAIPRARLRTQTYELTLSRLSRGGQGEPASGAPLERYVVRLLVP